MIVAAFIEEEINTHQAQTVKQDLAALRKLFDYLVTGQIVPFKSGLFGARASVFD